MIGLRNIFSMARTAQFFRDIGNGISRSVNRLFNRAPSDRQPTPAKLESKTAAPAQVQSPVLGRPSTATGSDTKHLPSLGPARDGEALVADMQAAGTAVQEAPNRLHRALSEGWEPVPAESQVGGMRIHPAPPNPFDDETASGGEAPPTSSERRDSVRADDFALPDVRERALSEGWEPVEDEEPKGIFKVHDAPGETRRTASMSFSSAAVDVSADEFARPDGAPTLKAAIEEPARVHAENKSDSDKPELLRSSPARRADLQVHRSASSTGGPVEVPDAAATVKADGKSVEPAGWQGVYATVVKKLDGEFKDGLHTVETMLRSHVRPAINLDQVEASRKARLAGSNEPQVAPEFDDALAHLKAFNKVALEGYVQRTASDLISVYREQQAKRTSSPVDRFESMAEAVFKVFSKMSPASLPLDARILMTDLYQVVEKSCPGAGRGFLLDQLVLRSLSQALLEAYKAPQKAGVEPLTREETQKFSAALTQFANGTFKVKQIVNLVSTPELFEKDWKGKAVSAGSGGVPTPAGRERQQRCTEMANLCVLRIDAFLRSVAAGDLGHLA